ncbi:YidH family protein [Chitinophaga sp. XS-30]|uniref:YidH family protein n=1 Tax=Chitinophaga sp. XS-30 TaxID=2604421 RepID=UPI0011DD9C07|nr:DUF202 domain-containing protein [Chitinophaga sp. XS-30]QEH41468.1 DUF202 domain-containing protein [Chitinophaga sp. XS-30]
MDTRKDTHKTPSGKATDHLANERTFLAWIRTAIAIMAFGFVVVKFSLFIRQLAYAFSDKAIPLPQHSYSGIIGVFLVSLGGVISLLSFMRYKKIERNLNEDVFYPSSRLIILLTLFILLGAVLLVWYLLWSL